MGCCKKPKTSSPTRLERAVSKRKEDVLLRIPGASVYLMEDSETAELAKGDLILLKITEEDVPLATVVKIGPELRWPLTKDEPVIKLDDLHYLFSLPDQDGGFLNYGVSFPGPDSTRLASLDSFLQENSCFSTSLKSSNLKKAPRGSSANYEVYWRDYAPRVEEYNGVLAKGIAGGTGQIVKGIFKCTNAYTSQVQKGADLIAVGSKNGVSEGKAEGEERANAKKKRGGINSAIRGVRKISEMTENMSRSLLNGVLLVSGTVSAPLVRSKPGQAFMAMVPGEVLLASLDAMNKVLDAVEVAQRKALDATSGAVSGEVSKRFGESAGEVAGDMFTTGGHVVGTAWNILKIRKAVRPSSLPSAGLKNALKKKT